MVERLKLASGLKGYFNQNPTHWKFIFDSMAMYRARICDIKVEFVKKEIK